MCVDGEEKEEEEEDGEDEDAVKWEKEDVVGVMYDADLCTVQYTLNGVSLPGVKREGVSPGMVMGISLNTGVRVRIRIAEGGENPMQYRPKGYRAVADLLLEHGGEGGGGEAAMPMLSPPPSTTIAETTTITTKTATTTTTTAAVAPAPTPAAARALRMSEVRGHTLSSLTSLPLDTLKLTLQDLGLKAGGTAADRAQRLLTVKGVKREDIPVKIRDKKTFDMCTERLKRTGEL